MGSTRSMPARLEKHCFAHYIIKAIAESYYFSIIPNIFILFDTNESNYKLILLERRFDVIFTSFSSSIKVRYYLMHSKIENS